MEHERERYLVVMPGTEPQWVKNMRAAGGTASLRHGRRGNLVHLEELAPSKRAPVLQAWYRVTALSANPRRHFEVDRHAPLAEFERLAPSHPVFRIVPAG